MLQLGTVGKAVAITVFGSFMAVFLQSEAPYRAAIGDDNYLPDVPLGQIVEIGDEVCEMQVEKTGELPDQYDVAFRTSKLTEVVPENQDAEDLTKDFVIQNVYQCDLRQVQDCKGHQYYDQWRDRYRFPDLPDNPPTACCIGNLVWAFTAIREESPCIGPAKRFASEGSPACWNSVATVLNSTPQGQQDRAWQIQNCSIDSRHPFLGDKVLTPQESKDAEIKMVTCSNCNQILEYIRKGIPSSSSSEGSVSSASSASSQQELGTWTLSKELIAINDADGAPRQGNVAVYGDTITFRITATNNTGSDWVNPLFILDAIPMGLLKNPKKSHISSEDAECRIVIVPGQQYHVMKCTVDDDKKQDGDEIVIDYHLTFLPADDSCQPSTLENIAYVLKKSGFRSREINTLAKTQRNVDVICSAPDPTPSSSSVEASSSSEPASSSESSMSLSITQSVHPNYTKETYNVGDTIVYVLEVTNDGDEDVVLGTQDRANVVITDKLPVDLTAFYGDGFESFFTTRSLQDELNGDPSASYRTHLNMMRVFGLNDYPHVCDLSITSAGSRIMVMCELEYTLTPGSSVKLGIPAKVNTASPCGLNNLENDAYLYAADGSTELIDAASTLMSTKQCDGEFEMTMSLLRQGHEGPVTPGSSIIWEVEVIQRDTSVPLQAFNLINYNKDKRKWRYWTHQVFSHVDGPRTTNLDHQPYAHHLGEHADVRWVSNPGDPDTFIVSDYNVPMKFWIHGTVGPDCAADVVLENELRLIDLYDTVRAEANASIPEVACKASSSSSSESTSTPTIFFTKKAYNGSSITPENEITSAIPGETVTFQVRISKEIGPEVTDMRFYDVPPVGIYEDIVLTKATRDLGCGYTTGAPPSISCMPFALSEGSDEIIITYSAAMKAGAICGEHVNQANLFIGTGPDTERLMAFSRIQNKAESCTKSSSSSAPSCDSISIPKGTESPDQLCKEGGCFLPTDSCRSYTNDDGTPVCECQRVAMHLHKSLKNPVKTVKPGDQLIFVYEIENVSDDDLVLHNHLSGYTGGDLFGFKDAAFIIDQVPTAFLIQHPQGQLNIAGTTYLAPGQKIGSWPDGSNTAPLRKYEPYTLDSSCVFDYPSNGTHIMVYCDGGPGPLSVSTPLDVTLKPNEKRTVFELPVMIPTLESDQGSLIADLCGQTITNKADLYARGKEGRFNRDLFQQRTSASVTLDCGQESSSSSISPVSSSEHSTSSATNTQFTITKSATWEGKDQGLPLLYNKPFRWIITVTEEGESGEEPTSFYLRDLNSDPRTWVLRDDYNAQLGDIDPNTAIKRVINDPEHSITQYEPLTNAAESYTIRPASNRTGLFTVAAMNESITFWIDAETSPTCVGDQDSFTISNESHVLSENGKSLAIAISETITVQCEDAYGQAHALTLLQDGSNLGLCSAPAYQPARGIINQQTTTLTHASCGVMNKGVLQDGAISKELCGGYSGGQFVKGDFFYLGAGGASPEFAKNIYDLCRISSPLPDQQT